MSVPAKRRSRSKARRGRAHSALAKTNLSSCPKCNKAVMSHSVCSFCGTYKGREVRKVKSKSKKAKK
ncbi:50S ribosomal protein L32 [Candidatus Falkowbacteria bacterium]|nr:50S ribosomal protein L32 [Candidatus Falkowbacteria bacterium]